ncbi:MAG: glycine--tRNA ligase [Gemmatimonadetes bacterium]|nr:glycine--tRNA ligase [Gemmatimonadota bacterium]
MAPPADLMDRLVSLCKRRGFVYPSSEIYGGIGSSYDYGPLGVELKRNVKEAWWRAMVREREDVEGLDSAILMNPRVWEASGHVAGFTDPLVDCKVCKGRFRVDALAGFDPAFLAGGASGEGALTEEGRTRLQCPRCGSRDFSDVRKFNLMFKTWMGPLEEDASVAYLRPETAQGIYVNFLNVLNSSRQKIPFGIGQIGKAFRNEITPGNFIFRTREFEQMEMQYFVHPADADRWFDYWRDQRLQFYRDLGLREERLRLHPHAPDELAHYARAAYDIQYEFPFGWQELEGIHNRGDFDLSRHEQFSGKKLSYFDEATKQRFVPFIVETSAGCDRTVLTLLVDAYEEEGEGKDVRVVLRFSPRVAPIKVAVLPLVNRDNMDGIARALFEGLKSRFAAFYDEGGSIGRRYRRQDEAGTPYCLTVDSQTLDDDTVTARERDSMRQERVPVAGIAEYLAERV